MGYRGQSLPPAGAQAARGQVPRQRHGLRLYPLPAHPDGMREAIADYVERGFRAIKFGWGVFGYDLALDVALVRAAREEAGPGVTLMVDAGWYGTRYDE